MQFKAKESIAEKSLIKDAIPWEAIKPGPSLSGRASISSVYVKIRTFEL